MLSVDQNQLKQAVAKAAVEYCLTKIDSDSIVGIGTGSTANCFIDQIAEYKHLFNGTVASSEGSMIAFAPTALGYSISIKLIALLFILMVPMKPILN